MVVETYKSYKGSYADRVNAMMKETKKQLKTTISDSDLEGLGFDPDAVRNSVAINGSEQIKYDFTNQSCQKRANATVKSISEAKKRLRGKCSPTEIEAFFAFSNDLIMRGGYNYAVDRYNTATLAAAIWILDELTLEDKIHDVLYLLPYINENDYPEDLVFIPVLHPMYDMNLIVSMVQLIRHRNTAEVYKDPSYGAIYWDKKKPDQDEESHENRNAFDRIISMINREKIDEAVHKYTEKVWEFYEIAFQIYKAKEQRERDLSERLRRADAEINDIAFNVLNNASKVVASKPNFNIHDFSDNDTNRIKRGVEADKIERELERLRFITFTDLTLVNERERTAEDLNGIITDDLKERLIDFHVDDPFETAFALLYMLDTGNTVPWLYYGSMGVAYTMCDQFPFDTDIPDDFENLQGEDSVAAVLLDHLNEKLYRHSYEGYRKSGVHNVNGELVERKKATNLSQLLYMNTSVLFPRVSKRETASIIPENKDNKTETDRESLELVSYLMNAQNFRTSGFSQYRWLNHMIEEIKDSYDETALEEDNLDLLKQDNERLRKKNRELAGIVSALNSENKEAERLAEQAHRINDQQSRELADLRDLVYLLQNEKEPEEEVAEEIKFPCETQKKIVSFGGHMAWIKEMRKRFPNIAFVEPETIPNTALVQNADVVWIQTNCISHSDYYRILNSAKNKNIPVRYFVYSSADKCSKQLIESEELLS